MILKVRKLTIQKYFLGIALTDAIFTEKFSAESGLKLSEKLC